MGSGHICSNHFQNNIRHIFCVYWIDMKEIWIKLIEYCPGAPRRQDNKDYKLLVYTPQMGSGHICWNHIQNIVRHNFYVYSLDMKQIWIKLIEYCSGTLPTLSQFFNYIQFPSYLVNEHTSLCLTMFWKWYQQMWPLPICSV